MDGFEVFRRLRSDILAKHVPIVMLTGINDLTGEHHDAASMEHRFGLDAPEAFVDKPVDPAFLQRAIMGVVG
jgi:CheY-like chemotaxis protein